jgi:hypothetical protein
METQATTSNFEAIRALQEEAQGRGASEAEAEMVEVSSAELALAHATQTLSASEPGPIYPGLSSISALSFHTC